MKKIIFLIFQIFFSLIVVSFLDYKIGYKFIKEPKYIITKYDHDLRKNIKIYEKGKILYTNNYGFKSADGSSVKNKHFDIAFIGDSFTEGVGVEYQNTFVGIFHNKTNKRVINLGVSSYSPSIYLEKIKYYLDKGFKFDEVIVFIDISDIQDEAAYYIQDENNYIYTRKKGVVNKLYRDLHITLIKFPLTYSLIAKLKDLIKKLIKHIDKKINHTQIEKIDNNNKKINNDQIKKTSKSSEKPESLKVDKVQNFKRYNELSIYDYYSVGLYDYNYSRSFWTYKNDNTPYEPLKIEGGINRSLKKMKDLHNILDKNNIKLSVGVYPWPGQILYDARNSRQVKIWSNFCLTRCYNFFNIFNFFFDEIQSTGNKNLIINKYYLQGDVHFNEAGNEVIANEILKKY